MFSLTANQMAHFEKRVPLIKALGFAAASLPKLKAYIELLWSSNEDLNLISRKMSFEELIDNHVIDCLLPLHKFPLDVKEAADFGAGGGLPGVIYAIQFSQVKYHLFEKSPKKREFLLRCCEIAPNLEIQGEIPNDLGAIDVITARAFKPLDVILEMSQGYYRSQKYRYFLLKGRREKIDEEVQLARKKFKNLTAEVVPLKSPLLEVERNLVLISNS
jgi:16S rRNA (guanine527-N7)-methyltransferase